MARLPRGAVVEPRYGWFCYFSAPQPQCTAHALRKAHAGHRSEEILVPVEAQALLCGASDAQWAYVRIVPLENYAKYVSNIGKC